jgi:hypothetical protein
MKARWLLSIGAVTVTLALAGTDVVQADQARPRNSEAAGRSSGGGSSGGGGGSAVSRAGGSSGGGSSARTEPSRPRTAAPRRSSGAERSVGTARRRAPDYSRPSTGRAVTGRAVARGRVPGGGGGSTIIVRPRTFYPWGLGWGGGYFYDPFWFGGGYWDPLWGPAWGGGYWGHGWGPGYWGGPGYGYGYGGYRPYEREDRGALRLKVRPREAEVFIEGDFVGEVDDYDGAFQRLHLPPGRHRVQVRAEGYEPLDFSVLIVRDQTVTYRGELRER